MLERLGPYRILRQIGRGGMGTVYEAVDVATGQPAAIKLLGAELAGHAGLRDRFEAEIDALRKLNHPNIVRLIGFGEQDEQLFYVMELVSGSSLEDLLGRGRTFDWREATEIGIETCRALRHAHDRGVIHRDLKPGNLLLTLDGHVKLSDFGIARLFGNLRAGGPGSVAGTAEYMAPEQAQGRAVDPRTDLYSLGCVLYVLLARRPVFQGESFAEILQKQQFEQPEPLGRFAPDVPVELQQTIHQLLEKDPERRIPNATLLARRLEALEHALSLDAAAEEAEADDEPQGGGPPAAEGPPADGPPPAAGPPAPLGPTRPATAAGQPPPPPDKDLPETKFAGARKPEAAETPPEALKPAGRFVPVRPGDLDRPERSETATTWISPQTWALAVGLIVVGVIAWYLLQPVSADALYERISTQTKADSSDSLLAAEDDIRQFLMRFPADPRCEELRASARAIDLSRLERKLELRAKGLLGGGSLVPIERLYVEALNYAWLDPEAGLARFQAIIDLYGSEMQRAGPTAQCVELARRRVAQLREQLDAQVQEHLALILERLDEADKIRPKDPARATAIYRAVLRLYADKAWAAEAVHRAAAALGETGSDRPAPPLPTSPSPLPKP
jgi:serine/threonine-protein kinase